MARLIRNAAAEGRVAIRWVRRLCAEKEIAGFEVMDLAPILDPTYLSALNANHVLNSCLVGIAIRKQGFSADYVSPLMLDHGQD